MAPPPDKAVYYFCDESSQSGDRFMAVAGLAVPDTAVDGIRDDLIAIKKANGNPTEVKWSDTKARRESPEKAFADYFEEAVKAKKIHFHIRFAPFHQYDHKASGPGRRADTTSKMHFQLLLHRALRYYGPHYKLRIRPDNGRCTEQLPRQVANLHWQARELYGTGDCIEHLQCLDSKREPLLQLLDIPLGAMTALRNLRPLTGAKAELAQHISAMWPRLDLARNTPIAEYTLNIWNVTPKGAPRRGPWS